MILDGYDKVLMLVGVSELSGVCGGVAGRVFLRMVAFVELVVIDPSGFVLLSTKFPGGLSLCDLGKLISAILDSSKGELCEVDQSKPPLGLSIMCLNLTWHSLRVSPITSIMESSTKPGDNSSEELAVSMSEAL